MGSRLSPALRERIRAAVHARAAPTRSASRAAATVLHVGYGIALALGLSVAVALRSGSPRAVTATVRLVLSFVVTALTATGLTAPTPGTSVLGRRNEELAVVLGAAPVSFLVAFQEYGAWLEPASAPWWPCAAATLGLGALFVACAFRARAHRVPHRPALHGAALAATAGLWASALVFTVCPSLDPLHLVTSHVAPLVVLGAAGALTGRTALALRVR